MEEKNIEFLLSKKPDLIKKVTSIFHKRKKSGKDTKNFLQALIKPFDICPFYIKLLNDEKIIDDLLDDKFYDIHERSSRENMREKIFAKLYFMKKNINDNEKIARVIEDECFTGIEETHDPHLFDLKYGERCYVVLTSIDRLKKPPNLGDGIRRFSEICSEEFSEIKDKIKRRVETKIEEAISKLYKCNVCGKNSCITREVQIRSLDEAQDIICTCTSCNHIFRVRG